MEMKDPSVNHMMQVTDFGLQDFIDETNFEQFIDLIREESANSISSFNPIDDHKLMDECLVGSQFSPAMEDLYGVFDSSYVLSSFPCNDGGTKGEEEENDEEDSSGTTTTTTPTKRTKTDRSRTLISERRRRSRMKEKLYALRSLVPNITKMDKASIVGDAVLYVQEMQLKAKKLKAEIAALEVSSARTEKQKGSIQKPKIQLAYNHPVSMRILQMDVFQVEERGFYVKLECNKGKGVAVSLYKALESLTSFTVRSSNLASISDKFTFTFTLDVKECREDMTLPNLKLWVTGALLSQGFDFLTPSAP